MRRYFWERVYSTLYYWSFCGYDTSHISVHVAVKPAMYLLPPRVNVTSKQRGEKKERSSRRISRIFRSICCRSNWSRGRLVWKGSTYFDTMVYAAIFITVAARINYIRHSISFFIMLLMNSKPIITLITEGSKTTFKIEAEHWTTLRNVELSDINTM